jgi:ABC-type phosphate/phosphonate transport system substrate-binding protein
MQRRLCFSTLVVASLVLAEGVAFAGPHDVAILVTRIGGDTASAQPYIDRFLRIIEKGMGWQASSAKGSFLTTRKALVEYRASGSPGLGMMDPPAYFELQKEWSLRPLLQVESAELVSNKLHVVVKAPEIRTLADLQGKRVWTTVGDYPRYLSKVVLAGQVDAASSWQLKQIGQALKGVRGVIRGDCDATLLDDEQLAKAKTITGGADLRAIYSSPALPQIPVVEFGDSLPEKERNTFVKTLLDMCSSPSGAPVCKEMHITRFSQLDKAVFDAAQKRMGE